MRGGAAIVAVIASCAIGVGDAAAADPPSRCEDYTTVTGADGQEFYVQADVDRGTWTYSDHYVDAEVGIWQESNGQPGLQCPTGPEDTGGDKPIVADTTFVPVTCPSVWYVPDLWVNQVLQEACWAIF